MDTLIPLIGLATVDTKVVLAGDPKQLGPVESLDYVNRQGLCKFCYKGKSEKS